jgi:acyl-CoA synthetase (NDP forming)
MTNTSLRSLFAPKGIAVVGASQGPARGNSIIKNLKQIGYQGKIFAVNPRYSDVLGAPCVASVMDLPGDVDCIVSAINADATCQVLEDAMRHGIAASVVLAAGFGEGGKGYQRGFRLKALSDAGMAICGPNCYGVLNLIDGVAAYSGAIPSPTLKGKVALISQSGGLGSNALQPLMGDRRLGFSYVISCGNQVGVSIEDYVEFIVEDGKTEVVGVIVESLRNPQKLLSVAATAHHKGITLLFLQTGRSKAGKVMVQSHTGALVENSDVMAAFLRKCGVVQIEEYDEFVEALELMAHVPVARNVGTSAIVIAGSGGNATVAADTAEKVHLPLAEIDDISRALLAEVMPAFGNVTNPIDGTGAIYDDEAMLPKLMDAVLQVPGVPVIAINVSAKSGQGQRTRRFAETVASISLNGDRCIAAYQYSHLGGDLDPSLVNALHEGGVPLLLGTQNAMKALRYLGVRNSLRDNFSDASAKLSSVLNDGSKTVVPPGFMAQRTLLLEAGIPVVDTRLARTADEALAAFRELGRNVALKVEAKGLLHKTEIGGVFLNCNDEKSVLAAFATASENALRAGYSESAVLLQPMTTGVCECLVGILQDDLFGPVVSVSLGGIYVEILGEAVTESAPVTFDKAMTMILGMKGAMLLQGARGKPAGDVAALANLISDVSRFAFDAEDSFRSLDLNPVIVMPKEQGVQAVDIAFEL